MEGQFINDFSNKMKAWMDYITSIENDETTHPAEEIDMQLQCVLTEFVRDVQTTFPEYSERMSGEDYISTIFDQCKFNYIASFYEIVNKDERLFSVDYNDNNNTEFLPGVNFKEIWMSEISSLTKDAIWKYLNIVLKLIIKKTIGKMTLPDFINTHQDMWTSSSEKKGGANNDEEKEEEEDSNDDGEDDDTDDDPSAQFETLLNGNVGKFATEIAEDVIAEMNITGLDASSNLSDIFTNFLGDPNQFMGLVSTVAKKLDAKMKSGEISQSDILKEKKNISKIMKNLKNMPGAEDLLSIFSKLGMDTTTDGDVNAEKLKRRMKLAKTKERIRMKAMQRQRERDEAQQQQHLHSIPAAKPLSDAELVDLFHPEKEDKKKKKKKN
jgi:transcriptional regulator with XRE-family HTH domain